MSRRLKVVAIAVTVGMIASACSGGSESSSESGPANETVVATTTVEVTEPNVTEAPEPVADDEPDPTTPPETTSAPTTTEALDTDADGEPDATDDDDDNDGVSDVDDLDPLDPERSLPLAPLAEIVGGRPVLTDGALNDQLQWAFGEWSSGESTSADEVVAAFDPDYLANFETQGIVDFMNGVRSSWEGFEVTEVLALHPALIQAIIQHPNGVEGLLQLGVTLDGTDLINFIGVRNFEAGTLADEYVALDIDGTVAAIEEQAERTAVLVARIDDGVCTALVERNATQVMETASMFKGYALGAAAEAVANGELSLDTPIPIDPAVVNENGSQLFASPEGTEWTLLDHATLMMAISDNTATDHVMTAVGRDALADAVVRLGHTQPELLTPFLTTTELFHLIVSVPDVEAEAYTGLSEDEQRTYADTVLEPLGGIPFDHFRNGSNTEVISTAGWRAAPTDLCSMIAGLRNYPRGSDALRLVDAAYGGAPMPAFVTRNWERTWFKGGSLGSSVGLRVLTLGYMVESDDRGTYVVIAMANDDEGPIDRDAFFSLTQRLLLAVEQEEIS